MTKTELIKVLENINDDEKIVFLYTGTDRNGCPQEQATYDVQVETAESYYARVRADAVKRWEDTIAMAEARITKLIAEMEEVTCRAAAKRNATRIRTIKQYENAIKVNRERIAMGAL